MQIILISGDGIGAGKSTLAGQLGDVTWSLAGALRSELQLLYPGFDWFNKTQAYKANTRVKEWGDKSLREVLVEYGQLKCHSDPAYWVRKLADRLEASQQIADGVKRVAIDDIRKPLEVEHLRSRFRDTIHIHVSNPGAIPEPQFPSEKLAEIADYKVEWKRGA